MFCIIVRLEKIPFILVLINVMQLLIFKEH